MTTPTATARAVFGYVPWKVSDLRETFWYLADATFGEEQVCSLHRAEVHEASLEASAKRVSVQDMFLSADFPDAPEQPPQPLYSLFEYHARSLRSNRNTRRLVACSDDFYL